MHPLFARFALCLVLAFSAQSAFSEKLDKAIDRVAEELVGTRTPGLSIAIDKGGKTLFAGGYGYADTEKKVRATPETVYRIGSITKQFTAVAIVQLIDAGKMSLDKQIQELVTGYPQPAKPVTLRNLLQHTSGIPSFTSLPSYMPNMADDVTHADMIARFDALPLEFDPGSKWKYNNSGYYLLGMVIENGSGQSYSDYLEKHVFAPAAMNDTDYETAATLRAQGYRRNGGEFPVAGPISMTQPFAAGALVSTVGDLVRWQRALVDGRLSPPDALARITADLVKVGESAEEQYGYGIGVSTREGRRVISHGGGINGFVSLLAYFPETDHTIAILANCESFNTGRVLEKTSEALFGPAPETKETPAATEAKKN